MQMIEDSKKGIFDLIVAKEVSRFSRDTIDSLFYTRKLLEYDVCVYFLSDNIITASNVVTINARALPSSATNRTLTYSMPEVSFATLKNNVVKFTKAGTVVVSIATTDGSNRNQTDRRYS